jgi:valyl-tRNA synthetase
MIILLSITVVSLHFQECIKPVFSDTERDKTAIKQTLFDCVDTFLRAASPFMPYLTEELYQRLHICNEQRSESICVAQSNLYIKATQREPENVAFMSSCPLYTG